MTDTMIQWIVGQAGMGAVAALALVMLRESYQMIVRQMAQTIERERADKELLVQTVSQAREAMTMLTSAIERMNSSVQRCEYLNTTRKA